MPTSLLIHQMHTQDLKEKFNRRKQLQIHPSQNRGKKTSTVEPHYYTHLRAKHFWLVYRGGCFTEVQMYRFTSLGT